MSSAISDKEHPIRALPLVDRASTAFAIYRLSSVADRARLIARTAAVLEQRSDELARLITTEVGKTIRSARAEVAKSAAMASFYAENAAAMLADEPVALPHAQAVVRYDPLGPVVGIMPWNFPLWQLFRFAIPALAAGNTVIVKHSPAVPRCAAAIEALFIDAGFADGVISVASVGSAIVEELLDDRRIRAVVLTGGYEAGSQVASRAGARVRKVVLELGGSDAFIVMPSAHIEDAVAAAVRSRIHCNGQACTAAKRFIIHAAVYDDFVARFVAAMESLHVGDPFDERTDIGPLANDDVVARLERQVAGSIAAGARLLTGGHRLDGRLYAPTVLAEVPPSAPAAQEETFGPVAAMFRVLDIDDAIRIANASRYGLAASIWTADRDEAERCIRDIEAGQVYVNTIVSSDPRLPFGGTKDSGFGRELGIHGLRELANIKTVVTASRE